jgi:hypothetical protein
MLQLLKRTLECPLPARPDGLTGLESSRFCHSAEVTEARSERGEGVRRCPGVGPRHGANSGGGNEPRFRPAGEVKNIVYENRGAFNKYYLL